MYDDDDDDEQEKKQSICFEMASLNSILFFFPLQR